MRCFGDYQDDRICDLCGEVKSDKPAKCQMKKIKNEITTEKIDKFIHKCKHRDYEIEDGYEIFYICKKNKEICKYTQSCGNL